MKTNKTLNLERKKWGKLEKKTKRNNKARSMGMCIRPVDWESYNLLCSICFK